MKEINKNTIGGRIAEIRIKRGFTQEELAERLFMNKKTLSAYENNNIDIKSSILIDIAKALDCPAAYLLEGKHTMTELQEEAMKIILDVNDEKVLAVAIMQLKALKALR